MSLARRVPASSRGRSVPANRVAPETVKYYPATGEISFRHPTHCITVRHDGLVFHESSSLREDESTVVISFPGETLLFDAEILRAVMPHVKWG